MNKTKIILQQTFLKRKAKGNSLKIKETKEKMLEQQEENTVSKNKGKSNLSFLLL